MHPLLAVLDSTDVIAIAIIVWAIIAMASINRSQPNLVRLDRKLDALLQHHGIELPSPLSPEVQKLACDPRQKIAAIKLHRQQTGLSLKDAKNEVEAFSGN